ncbi:hypothetical protein, partial [Klebsiella pneumoniae]
FAGKKSAQIREILISESAWEEMTCLFAPSLTCTSWHYSNSPKNRKTALSPRHDWLHGGSEQKKDPLRIWFFPQ